MILTAKVTGPEDGLAEYKRYLEDRAAKLGRDGTVRPPADTTIAGTVWVDATLKGSDLSDYLTRYLATIKNGVAILFTSSAHRPALSDMEGTQVLVAVTFEVPYDWKQSK